MPPGIYDTSKLIAQIKDENGADRSRHAENYSRCLKGAGL
jgi:hypothetical protein